MTAYEEAARRIPVGEGAQVIVAGGGAGGIAAALSARRMGCTVLLIDKAGAPTRTGDNYLALRAYAMDAQSQREALEAGDPYVARRRLRFGATLSGKGQPEGVPTVAGVTAQETTDFALAARRMLFEQMQREPRLAMDVVNLPQMAQLRTIRHIVGAATFMGTEDHARAEDSIGVIPDFMYPGRLYELPYRSLYAPGYAGLLTCGRTISAEGWGWHASRVLGPVFLTGQAAGAAARFMLDLQGEPWAVPVGKLQEVLRETGLAMHTDELGE